MIERIEIKSFKSLQNVSLDLGKFTVLVGESTSGKSSVIQALQSIVFGLRGNDHVTVSDKHSSVSVTNTDHVFIYEKGPGKNSYQVVDRKSGNKVHDLSNFGVNIPEQVREMHDIAESNFSDQWEKPFLLQESGSQIAKVLGDLTNVSVIIDAILEGNKTRKELSTELIAREKDLESNNRLLKDFDDLPSQTNSMNVIESRLNIAQSMESNISDLVQEIENLESHISSLENTVEYPDLPDTQPINTIYEQYTNLSRLITDLARHQNILDRNPLPDLPDEQSLVSALQQWYTLMELNQKFTECLAEHQAADSSCLDAEIQIADTEQELEHMLEEAGVCPTCQRPTQ